MDIRGIKRVHNTRLSFWTLFPLAITPAIYGFRCYQVAELHIN
jgi:hypothetical protein